MRTVVNTSTVSSSLMRSSEVIRAQSVPVRPMPSLKTQERDKVKCITDHRPKKWLLQLFLFKPVGQEIIQIGQVGQEIIQIISRNYFMQNALQNFLGNGTGFRFESCKMISHRNLTTSRVVVSYLRL